MRKYILAILIIILIVISGVHKIQSQTEENKYNKQNINIDQPIQPIRSTNFETIKIAQLESEPIIMKATAYTKSKEEGTHKGITKSGTLVSRGTVAVDPKLIPLGTKLYIEGYGHAVAYDTGGDIKHDRIDLYMETKKEAFEFGRKDVRVWIVTD
jgi:3D (Asp-Asp-Asp) domain-containing protein